MASIGKDHNGFKRVLFPSGGKRKTIRLGKASVKQAEAFKVKVESLVTAGITGSMDDETARWVAGLDGTIRARLEAVGLIEKVERKGSTLLGTLMKEFFASLQVKRGTSITYNQIRQSMEAYFGVKATLDTLTPLNAEQWRQSMKTAGLADATVSKRVKTARQMLRQAADWGMIEKNPFDKVKAGGQTNKARQFFITEADAQKVLASCPSLQWRLLFALSRYGGLRCPSEHLALQWGDIDWAKERFFVRKNKTESRWVPLFPELLPLLREAFEHAEDGSINVIIGTRKTSDNLRTQLKRIVVRAGLKPWPKTWHNLRASRQTELAARFPIHVVCSWLGNSPRVAQDHYLQVTDTDFAAGSAPVKGVQQAAQNPAQYASETTGNDRKAIPLETKNPPVLAGDFVPCHILAGETMTLTGFEPVSRP